MPSSISNNKRIAKNTLIVYFRLLVTIAINLITSRIVLQALGASDFGLYSIVGGVVSMFTFISGALSNSTTRFLNYEIGKRENGNPNKIFNISYVLHIVFAIIILILAETIGIFYILNYLNVEPDKVNDAMFVFQVTTFVTCIGITNIPYQSVFIAHEKFMTIAIIDIINTILKLAVAIGLLCYSGNGLRFYALGMSIMTLFSFVAYHYLAYEKWSSIVKWMLEKNIAAYKEILVFNNYSLLGTASMIVRSQGSKILINYFFGTITNAAFAISNTVQNCVNGFIGSFDSASAPQITQNISAGNRERYLYLVKFSCRICIILMMLIYFPLVAELNYILHLWLGEIPEGTLEFCHYTLLIAVVSSTSGGLTKLINGLGKIKWFKIEVSVLYISSLILGYILFKYGYPAYYITILFIISDIISRCIQLFLLNRIDNFDIKDFVMETYFKPCIIFCIMSVFVYLYHKIPLENFTAKFMGVTSVFILTFCLVFILGLKKDEKNKLIKILFKGRFHSHQ